MSDTDDTDDLLLIPPDLFSVNSDTDDTFGLHGPFYSVVDILISQVHSLEDRVNSIEAISDTSLMSASPKATDFISGVRKFSSLDELPQSVSAPSTPQKPYQKTKQNSLPATPNVTSTAPRQVRTPANIDEINKFISHVKVIQKYDAARNLNRIFQNLGAETQLNCAQKTGTTPVADAVKTLWTQENIRNVESSESSIVSEPTAKNEKLWRVGDNEGSVPDYGMGMRDYVYNFRNQKSHQLPAVAFDSQSQSSSDILSSVTHSETVLDDNTQSLTGSESSQLTTVHRNEGGSENTHPAALDIVGIHRGGVRKFLQEHNQENDDASIMRRKLALVSLSELWNQNLAGAGDYKDKDRVHCYNKLQEEKLRRQHCEELIKHLQVKNLELQERITVALKVDEAKDDAIVQIHKSWEDSTSQLDVLQKAKNQLELQIADIYAKTSSELLEASKKVGHYESESSKALNLAHSSQEKVVSLEKQNLTLLSDIQSYEDRLKKLEMDFEREHSNNQQLSKILSQKEIELNEHKNVAAQATKEINQSKLAVERSQAEITVIKSTQAQIELKYNEALTHIKDVETERRKLLTEIENYKKMEKNFRDDLSKFKEAKEKEKADLQAYFQNQVEMLVREKVKEFQQQLEKAQSTLQEEMRLREISIAKKAATHLQQINEKNVLEIHLLEEKHKEEIKLYKLQLFQTQQEVSNLQLKFQQQQERRANVVQKLQRVMEAQWSEALKIINNGKSPIVAQDKSTNTIDQLNHLKSRSYNNLEEILFREDVNVGRGIPKVTSGPSLRFFESSINSTLDDSYNKIMETPLSSRLEKTKQQSENDIQKYIQMLLNKQTVHTIDDPPLHYQEEYGNPTQLEGSKSSKLANKDRLGKPPWK